jgi:hypothetical protein
MRYNLPSGGWVEIRDPKLLKARDRKTVMRSMQDPEEGHMLTFAVDMTDGIAAVMVEDWKIPYLPDDAPLPSQNLAILDDLSIADESALQALPEMLEAAKLFKPGKPDPSDYDNPDSPTEPASA